ncbi:uncharacterized protein LOC127252933 [Andrographis paniculata]|uniref:uncharacterized protein LOC127252933 n=1 Tax=Andrographis paniculata TaxID=175694 RepID=UPI0021E78E17|nr:uncharacterized protein LOC127252933 [Andrographis paniculata]
MERTIKTLDDILRAFVLQFQLALADRLGLNEFSYNNSYHTSIKVAPFEDRIHAAQSQQKNYANQGRRDGEFEVSDRVLLRVSPMKGVKRFGIREKLSPRHIGPYTVLEHVGKLILQPDEVVLEDGLSYDEKLVQILDSRVKILSNKEIYLVKVFWNHHEIEEA